MASARRSLTAGLPADLARAFRRGWIEGKPRADLVDERLIGTFALTGTVEDRAQGMRRFADAGLETLVIRDDGESDVTAQLEAVDRVAEAAGIPLTA